jgi:hypothetical protein
MAVACPAKQRRIPADLPDSVYVGGKMFHVQGLAVDRTRGCMYFSFTSAFYKTDMQGNVLASIERIQGHLGAMTLSPVDGKVYASLECKDDEIGAGIASKLDVANVRKGNSVFYIAVIDVDKLNRIGMDPESDGVMSTVYLKETCDDYNAVIDIDGVSVDHRYGCSGIDGVTFAPDFGTKWKSGKKNRGQKYYLYVAYGIYGDNARKDNDHQVLLQYDTDSWESLGRPVEFGSIHHSGPAEPREKFFVRTGNTRYGVQNMAFDPFTGKVFMAVYKGAKPEFPNYSLFAADISSAPFEATLSGVPYDTEKKRCISLSDSGLLDAKSGISGWNFNWGSTGLCPVGGGYWYISENSKNKDKTNNCNARMYRWTGKEDTPFVKVSR